MTSVKLPHYETRVKSITVTATIFSDRVHGLVIRTVFILPDRTRFTIEQVEVMPLRVESHYWDYLAEDTLESIEAQLGRPWPVPWRGEFARTFKATVQEALKGVGV